jgi:hypothetical protein
MGRNQQGGTRVRILIYSLLSTIGVYRANRHGSISPNASGIPVFDHSFAQMGIPEQMTFYALFVA